MSGIRPKESAKCSKVIDFGECLLSINDKINTTIDSHLFSRTLQLLSTDSRLISAAEEHIKSRETFGYHLVKNIPIHVFINKILINAFVQTGQLFAVSVGKQIDTEDCLALLPNGILALSVKESTYRRIGIVGKKSILYRKKNCVQKYLIEIDLNNKHMTPGTKYYNRYDECLRRCGLTFDVFMKWEVVREELKTRDISSASIQNFFSYLKNNSNDDSLSNLQWFQCLPSLKSFTNNSVPIPLISQQVIDEDIHNLIEWFGAQMCQIECEVNEEYDVSTFGVTNYERRDDIHCLSISGFFTSSDIQSLFSEVKEQFFNSDKTISAIIVHGFEDSVVTWKGQNNEHSKNLSGENIYGIGVSKGLALIWRVADEYDFGVEKL